MLRGLSFNHKRRQLRCELLVSDANLHIVKYRIQMSSHRVCLVYTGLVKFRVWRVCGCGDLIMEDEQTSGAAKDDTVLEPEREERIMVAGDGPENWTESYKIGATSGIMKSSYHTRSRSSHKHKHKRKRKRIKSARERKKNLKESLRWSNS